MMFAYVNKSGCGSRLVINPISNYVWSKLGVMSGAITHKFSKGFLKKCELKDKTQLAINISDEINKFLRTDLKEFNNKYAASKVFSLFKKLMDKFWGKIQSALGDIIPASGKSLADDFGSLGFWFETDPNITQKDLDELVVAGAIRVFVETVKKINRRHGTSDADP